MRQYIDRETVRRMVYSSRNNLQMQNIFEQIPVADVRENVHGKWIERCEIDGGYGATCNICGEYCSLQYTDDRKFCPKCGAEMREVEV